MESQTTLLLILIILLFVLYYFSNCKPEHFAGNTNNATESVLMVFLTKQCPHCVNFDKNVHDNLAKELATKNIKIKKIYADQDPEKLFDQYQIMYVPAGIVVKDDETKKVNGEINFNNVVKTANSIRVK